MADLFDVSDVFVPDAPVPRVVQHVVQRFGRHVDQLRLRPDHLEAVRLVTPFLENEERK